MLEKGENNMELKETIYDTARILIEASNQIRSGLADAELSLDECPKIKKIYCQL